MASVSILTMGAKERSGAIAACDVVMHQGLTGVRCTGA